MTLNYSVKITLALALGFIVGGGATYYTLDTLAHQAGWPIHSSDHGQGDSDYHVHADFLIVIDNQRVDLTGDKYMSTTDRILHPDVHFHDNKDSIIHFHAPGVSLVEFIESISLSLTDSCLTLENTSYCSDETAKLMLFVNGSDTTNNILTYEPKDNDQIMLYYGPDDKVMIDSWLSKVSDRACIYTGTCPERGPVPPEECGLTCEV